MRRIEIKNFRGVDYSKDITQLDANQAAEMVNMELKNGSVETFKGWKCLYPMNENPTSGTIRKINYIGYNHIIDKIIFQTYADELDGWLYYVSPYTEQNNNAPVKKIGLGAIHTQDSTFFMRNYQYFLVYNNFARWDGNIAHDLEFVCTDAVAYIPTTVMGRAPSGNNSSQTAYEERNLLTKLFKNSFSGDGTSTLYYMNEKNLTATTVIVKVGTSTLFEGTHFTVDRVAGTVNFAAGTNPYGAPLAGTDNVIITAESSTADNSSRITQCHKCIIYGYGNNSRVFFYDNDLLPNTIFWSNVYDPTYFPELNYSEIGDKSSAITGVVRQLDSLMIIKESNNNDSTIWTMKQEFDTNGNAVFNVTQGISGIGIDAKNTLQTIEDKPTFLSNTGVYRISSTNIKDERIIEHISLPIDKELLPISSNNEWLSFDYDNKYGIVKDKKVYVFDYNSKYFKDNVIHYECCEWELPYNVTATAVIKGELYLGCDNGMIYIVKTGDSTHKHYWTEYSWVDSVYTETNEPVTSTWKLPLLNYDSDNKFKHIHKINVNASTKTSDGLFSLYSNSQKANELDFNRIAVNQGWSTPSENETYTVKNCVIDVNERDVLKHQLSFRPSKDIAIMSVIIDFSYGREYKGW